MFRSRARAGNVAVPYSSLVSADVPLGVLVDGSPGFLLPSRTLLEALLGNPMAPLGTSLVLQSTPLDVSLDAPLSTPLVVLLDAPLDVSVAELGASR